MVVKLDSFFVISVCALIKSSIILASLNIKSFLLSNFKSFFLTLVLIPENKVSIDTYNGKRNSGNECNILLQNMLL